MPDEDPNRREFLRSTAITGAVALGGTAAAGGASASSTFRSRPVDGSRTESLLAAEAGDLLSALFERGLVETDDVAALPTGPDVDRRSLAGESGSVYLERLDDGPDQVVVSLVGPRAGSATSLRLMVQPETGRAYAFYEDGEEYRFAELRDGRFVERRVDTQDHCTCESDECCYSWGACTDARVCCYSWGACDTDCGGC